MRLHILFSWSMYASKSTRRVSVSLNTCNMVCILKGGERLFEGSQAPRAAIVHVACPGCGWVQRVAQLLHSRKPWSSWLCLFTFCNSLLGNFNFTKQLQGTKRTENTHVLHPPCPFALSVAHTYTHRTHVCMWFPFLNRLRISCMYHGP